MKGSKERPLIFLQANGLFLFQRGRIVEDEFILEELKINRVQLDDKFFLVPLVRLGMAKPRVRLVPSINSITPFIYEA